jgi:hypothetical protein
MVTSENEICLFLISIVERRNNKLSRTYVQYFIMTMIIAHGCVCWNESNNGLLSSVHRNDPLNENSKVLIVRTYVIYLVRTYQVRDLSRAYVR